MCHVGAALGRLPACRHGAPRLLAPHAQALEDSGMAELAEEARQKLEQLEGAE